MKRETTCGICHSHLAAYQCTICGTLACEDHYNTLTKTCTACTPQKL